jgi:glycerol uptake facilitator-like aquaporin
MKKYPFYLLAKFIGCMIIILCVSCLILGSYLLDSKDLTTLWLTICLIMAGLVGFAIIIEKDEKR